MAMYSVPIEDTTLAQATCETCPFTVDGDTVDYLVSLHLSQFGDHRVFTSVTHVVRYAHTVITPPPLRSVPAITPADQP